MVHWQENSIITIKIHLENKWEEGIVLNVNVEKNKPDLAKKKKKVSILDKETSPKHLILLTWPDWQGADGCLS